MEKYEFPQVGIRLVKETGIMSGIPVDSARKVVALMQQYLTDKDREHFCAIYFKSNMVPVGFAVLSIGTVNQTYCDPKEVFKTALLLNTPNVILCHNHVSGQLTASKDDCVSTDRMVQAGKILGINVLDHVIIGAGNDLFYSFKENDMIDNRTLRYAMTKEEVSSSLSMVAEHKFHY